jgi:hypothetical protein
MQRPRSRGCWRRQARLRPVRLGATCLWRRWRPTPLQGAAALWQELCPPCERLICWASTEGGSATRSAPLRPQASGTPQYQRRDPKQHQRRDPKSDDRQFGWQVHQNPRWKNHTRVVAARPLLCALNTHWGGGPEGAWNCGFRARLTSGRCRGQKEDGQ